MLVYIKRAASRLVLGFFKRKVYVIKDKFDHFEVEYYMNFTIVQFKQVGSDRPTAQKIPDPTRYLASDPQTSADRMKISSR
jgi:hypothetical protein